MIGCVGAPLFTIELELITLPLFRIPLSESVDGLCNFEDFN